MTTLAGRSSYFNMMIVNIDIEVNILYKLCTIFVSCAFLVTIICGVLFCVLASSAVEHGLEAQLSQIKDYKIGICCLSTWHATLRSQSKNGLAQDRDNVSEWSEISTCSGFFQ